MPRESKKTPPSQMIRVPTPLIEAVQELSRLHRLGYTNAMLQGLKELISEIDSSSDIDFGASDEAIKQLALRQELLESRDSSDSDVVKSVTSLEQKLEAIQTRIAQMEGAISILGQRQQQTGPKRQAFTYHPPQVKLQPYNGENLAGHVPEGMGRMKLQSEWEAIPREQRPGRLHYGFSYKSFSQLGIYVYEKLIQNPNSLESLTDLALNKLQERT